MCCQVMCLFNAKWWAQFSLDAARSSERAAEKRGRGSLRRRCSEKELRRRKKNISLSSYFVLFVLDLGLWMSPLLETNPLYGRWRRKRRQPCSHQRYPLHVASVSAGSFCIIFVRQKPMGSFPAVAESLLPPLDEYLVGNWGCDDDEYHDVYGIIDNQS